MTECLICGFNDEEMQEIEQSEIQKAYELGKAEMQSSEDCISRADAINAMSNTIKRVFPEHRDIAEKTMNKLPPVTPQPKTGRWIKSRDSYGNNHFTCPFCEHDIATKADTWEDNYCANCGARLESEDKFQNI